MIRFKKPTILTQEEKLWTAKEYLDGKGSIYSIADKYGVTETSIRRWVDRYLVESAATLQKCTLPSSISPQITARLSIIIRKRKQLYGNWD